MLLTKFAFRENNAEKQEDKSIQREGNLLNYNSNTGKHRIKTGLLLYLNEITSKILISNMLIFARRFF